MHWQVSPLLSGICYFSGLRIALPLVVNEPSEFRAPHTIEVHISGEGAATAKLAALGSSPYGEWRPLGSRHMEGLSAMAQARDPLVRRVRTRSWACIFSGSWTSEASKPFPKHQHRLT